MYGDPKSKSKDNKSPDDNRLGQPTLDVAEYGE